MFSGSKAAVNIRNHARSVRGRAPWAARSRRSTRRPGAAPLRCPARALRLAERAVDQPFDHHASLAIDRALLRFERCRGAAA